MKATIYFVQKALTPSKISDIGGIGVNKSVERSKQNREAEWTLWASVGFRNQAPNPIARSCPNR